MKRIPRNILLLPLQKRAELALQKAVEGVIEEHARLRLPLYIGREGQVVKLSRTRYADSLDRGDRACRGQNDNYSSQRYGSVSHSNSA